jgi:hypothetical protein
MVLENENKKKEGKVPESDRNYGGVGFGGA